MRRWTWCCRARARGAADRIPGVPGATPPSAGARGEFGCRSSILSHAAAIIAAPNRRAAPARLGPDPLSRSRPLGDPRRQGTWPTGPAAAARCRARPWSAPAAATRACCRPRCGWCRHPADAPRRAFGVAIPLRSWPGQRPDGWPGRAVRPGSPRAWSPPAPPGTRSGLTPPAARRTFTTGCAGYPPVHHPRHAGRPDRRRADHGRHLGGRLPSPGGGRGAGVCRAGTRVGSRVGHDALTRFSSSAPGCAVYLRKRPHRRCQRVI